LKAVQTFWDSATCADVRAEVPGGLWLNEAPKTRDDAATGIYGTILPLGGFVEHHLDGHLEMPVIQFSLFSIDEDGHQGLMVARDEFVNAFDNALLTLADTPQGTATHFQMMRTDFGDLIKEPVEGWALHLEYQVGIDQAAA